MPLPQPSLTSERGVRRFLRTVEVRLRECWQTLRLMRANPRDDEFGGRLVRFQGELAGVLFDLATAYQQMEAAQKRLIKRKLKLNETWFRSRMARIEVWQRAVLRAMGSARCLGDGFAWFFYRQDHRLMEQHASQPRQHLMPTGVGGRGELEFVRQIPIVDGYFVLYHGTTTFLRLGDVSLVDRSTLRVVALGELKTQERSPGKLNIHVELVSQAPIGGNMPRGDRKGRLALPSARRDQLRRQVERMGNAIGAMSGPAPDHQDQVVVSSLIPTLAELMPPLEAGRYIVCELEQGHAVAAYVHRASSIFGREREQPSLEDPTTAERIQGAAIGVADREHTERNRFHLTPVGLTSRWSDGFLVGTLPLLWWPLPLDFLRRVVFGEVVLVSMLNTAWLTQRLEAAGIQVDFDERKESYSLSQILDGASLKLGNFNYFQWLMQGCLYSQDFVVDMILKLRDAALEQSGKLPEGSGGLKVNLSFVQRLGSPEFDSPGHSSGHSGPVP